MKAVHKRPYIRFGYKLLISYLLVVIIPLTIIGVMTYQSSVQSIKNLARTNISGTLQQIRDNILNHIEPIETISTDLYADKIFHMKLKGDYNAETSYELIKYYMQTKMYSDLSLVRNNIRLSLYINNPQIPEIYYDPAINPMLRGKTFELLQLNRIADAPWFLDLQRHPAQEMEWQQIDGDAPYRNISSIRTIYDDNSNLIAFVKMTVSLKDLFDSVDYRKIGQHSRLLVFDRQNRRAIYDSLSAEVGGERGSYLDAGKYLKLEEPIQGTNWTLEAHIPLSELEQNPKKVRNLTIGVSLLCFVLLTLLSLFISNHFSRRVDKLVQFLNYFRNGDFSRRIRYSGHDEFAEISSAFNVMAQTIDDLIRDVYASNLAKKDAELHALQTQINPHFMYNTLSSISRLAQLGRLDEMQQMVVKLSRFYRITLSGGKTIIPIQKEIQQVQAYIDIQKIKYGDQLEVSYDIDPEILRYETVKVILQPFVENALMHAWIEERIHIRIVGIREDDRAVFKVIDDGAGMSRHMIDGILLRQTAGFGINNVNERIKLHYGNRYGVSIYSNHGIGTAIRIEFPICGLPAPAAEG